MSAATEKSYTKKCDSRAELFIFCILNYYLFLTISLPVLAIVVALSLYYSHETVVVYIWSTYLVDMLCNAYILYLVVFLMKQTLLLDIFRTVALHS